MEYVRAFESWERRREERFQAMEEAFAALREALSPKRFARYLVFDRDFQEEIRGMIRDLRRRDEAR